MLNRLMTRGAEGNQVGKAIGLSVAADAEQPKGFDVVNVQLFSVLLFRFAAPLAGVIVAAASIAALLEPVRAVVGRVASAPVEIALAGNRLALPLCHTVLGTKAAARGVRTLYIEWLAALLTMLGNALVALGLRAADFRACHTGACAGNMNTEAGLRTEAGAARFAFGNRLAANLAVLFADGDDAKFALFAVADGRALTRTVPQGPTLAIPVGLLANRTNGVDAVVRFLTRHAAKVADAGLSLGWVEGIRLATLRANAFNAFGRGSAVSV